jgi:short subunit dehydrogenase-like uncharacterized protein
MNGKENDSMITLFGATGYTGSRIARVLDRSGIAFRIAGRSPEKLMQLSTGLHSKPAWIEADVTRPDTLPKLFRNTRVLINCAGPFTDLGEKVASLAAVNGTHYLDTTNELGYVYRMRTFDQMARRTGAALVPACAFEVAPADCAAAYLSRSCQGDIDQIDVVYHLPGSGSSRGTRLSALRSLATSWLGYQDGRWTGIVPGSRRSRFNLQCGSHPAVSIPSSESVTLTNHLSPGSIHTWMTTSQISSFLSPVFLPYYARFLRSLPGHSVLWAAGLQSPSAQNKIRSDAPFEILVALKDEYNKYTASIIGKGAYEITAEIVVYAVAILSSPDFKLTGVLSPAQILEPNTFFNKAETWGIHLTPMIHE